MSLLRAVIFDWAGTTIDYGCQAPVVVLGEIFADSGVELLPAEARHSMGLLKKDQIRAICGLPRVRECWAQRHGRDPREADVENLFERFLPRQIAVIERHSDVIPGVPEAVARMRARNLRIGSTTGYTRPMLEPAARRAAQQGYAPDASVTPDEVGGGRPLPWMCYQNALLLKVYPLDRCVKIGDTRSDIAEGGNAGMWTIGIAATGNQMGLTLAEAAAMPEYELEQRRAAARAELLAAGADFVIDSVAGCDTVLDAIEDRIAHGERPPRPLMTH